MKHIRSIAIVAALLAMGARDFKVTNPGPVQDAALDDPGAFTGMVRGVQYNVARATSINAFYGGVAAKEFSTAGRVNPTKLPINQGQLSVDDMSASNWTWSQSARWQAEDGVRRLRTVLGSGFATNKFAGQMLMYSALANRILGENFCEAVIDGGGKLPINTYFTRAETAATEAMTVAAAAADVPTQRAAQAIRATSRLYLGNFAGAAADAAAVPTSTALSLTAPFDATTKNLFVDTNDFAVGGSFRAVTVWRAYSESYFRTSGDLRARWDSSTVVTAGVGKARDGEFTGVPWFYPRKYIPTGTTADFGSPIRLVSAREMRLVEAEVALRNNDFATAATMLNGLRIGQAVRAGSPALTGYTITNVREGWNALRNESYIELWTEARTLGNLRRWIADNTYQTQFDVVAGANTDMADRVRLCVPISRGERTSNANLSLTPDDPESPIYNHTGAAW